MPSLIDGKTIADLVALDGLPRVAIDDEGTQHVLYLPNGAPLPHSMLASDWPGVLPVEPTPAESAAAIQARETKRVAARERRRARISLAQGAVGVHVKDLTAPQLRALTELLLLRAGALDDDLQVRPLDQWVGE